MAHLNRRIGPPELELHFWTGAVGANQSLVGTGDSVGLACRAVMVGNAAGALVLVDITNTARTYSAAEIAAAGNIIRGNWIQATAAGSAAHTLIAWW